LNKTIRITTLVENVSPDPRLEAEHGLAFWIETGSGNVLFDTGQGKALFSNARSLGINLEQTAAVVLSHGHYDHTGGLEKLLQAAHRVKVYAHPAAFRPKTARMGAGRFHSIGMPFLNPEAIRKQAEELIWTEQASEIGHGLRVTGTIPRVTEFENHPDDRFFLDAEGRQPDSMMDDQALFFEASRGVVVLLGCAHAGVINTLKYISQLTRHKPIYTVMGGMHLGNAAPGRIKSTIGALRDFKIERLGPAHCTGREATLEFFAAFPEKCFNCSVGTVTEFEVN
jgi:7,8-dihydropterin-6-yl-methyl-4-(beta-D-ribofuranosyl)aminobenzene 5'-phosphate synthase